MIHAVKQSERMKIRSRLESQHRQQLSKEKESIESMQGSLLLPQDVHRAVARVCDEEIKKELLQH